MGGSQGFCVQCGHELKQPTRFCTACGRSVTGTGQADQGASAGQQGTGREHEVTATMIPPRVEEPVPTEPVAAEPVPREPVAAEPGWPARYEPRPPASPPPPLPREGVPAPAGAGRYPPPSPRRERRWWALAIPATAVLAAGAAALYLFVLRAPHPSRAAAGGRGSASATVTAPTSSAPASPSPTPAEQQAASSLAALLAQSASDRSATVGAVSDVGSCGPGLGQDQQTLENSAASRQQLLGKLASLPGRSVLPPQMLQDLTNAWKESVTADQDLAQWAQDESSQGCSQDAQADPNYAAATKPDNQAKADKMAFVGEWNQIAPGYGLTSYKWDQL